MYELTTARGYPPSLQREGTAGTVEKVKWLRGTYGEEVKTQTPRRETEMSRSHEEKPHLWKEGCQRMPQKGTERRTRQRPHFRQQEGDHDLSFHSTIGEELGCKGVCLLLFRAAPAAYGSSQARGRIRAAAAAYTTEIASSKARDQTRILMDTSQVCNPLSHNGNSCSCPFICVNI